MKVFENKKWILVYIILFLILSVVFIVNDISNNYHWLYIVWMILFYLLIITGNLIYYLDKTNIRVIKIWKILLPLMALSLLVSMIVDYKYGGNTNEDDSLIFNIIAFMVAILLFYPSLRANYYIAYGKKINKTF